MTAKARHHGVPQVNTKKKLTRHRKRVAQERQQEARSSRLNPFNQKKADKVQEALEGCSDR